VISFYGFPFFNEEIAPVKSDKIRAIASISIYTWVEFRRSLAECSAKSWIEMIATYWERPTFADV